MDVALEYFRFSCRDADATHEFYVHVLQMDLLYRRALPDGRVRLVFKYHGNETGVEFAADSAGASTKRRLARAPHGREWVLVHTRSVASVLRRARDRGFVVYLDEVSPARGTTMAVLLDPSGVKIRLVETQHADLPLSRKVQARLAYVAVPVDDYSLVEQAVRFYGSLRKGEAVPGSEAARRLLEVRRRIDGDKQQAATFRMVDFERFVEDLTTYVWLANGPRDDNTCVCFFHRVPRVHHAQVAQAAAATAARGEVASFCGRPAPRTVSGGGAGEGGGGSGGEATGELSASTAAAAMRASGRDQGHASGGRGPFRGVSFRVYSLDEFADHLRGGQGPPLADPDEAARVHAPPGVPRYVRLDGPTGMSVHVSDGAVRGAASARRPAAGEMAK